MTFDAADWLRSQAGSDLETQIQDAVIVSAIRQSTVTQLCRKVQAPTRTNAIPVQTSRPVAKWVGTADTGQILSTKIPFEWEELIVEEVGCTVPIANTLLEDETFDIPGEITSQGSQALAEAIDNAVIFGVSKPSTWGDSIIENIASACGGRVAYGDGLTASSTTVVDTSASSADVGLAVYGAGIPHGVTVSSVSAGVHLVLSSAATVTATAPVLVLLPASASPFSVAQDIYSTSADMAQALLQSALQVSQSGYQPTAQVLAPGLQYQAALQRTTALVANPLASDSPFAQRLAGTLNVMNDPLKWAFTSGVSAITGAWSNAIVGIRRDVTIKAFDSGIILNSDGSIAFSLIDQDMSAFRITARLGFVIANPPVDASYPGTPNSFSMVVNTGTTGESPVGVVAPRLTPAAARQRSKRKTFATK